MQNTWQPNEKQQTLLNLLKEHPDGMTLRDAERLSGTIIKSGSVNALITKGMVETEEIQLDCNIITVATGEIVGHTKKKVCVYRLVRKD